MSNLSFPTTISYCFQHCDKEQWGSTRHGTAIDKSVYMTIPISRNNFEVPVFAMSTLAAKINFENIRDIDALVVNLINTGYEAPYKSLDASVRSVFRTGYSSNRLIKLTTVENNKSYYGTFGAIFDNAFKPVAMLLWQIEKVPWNNDIYPFKYRFVRPILRVIPEAIVNKSNTVERLILNKIIPATLDHSSIMKPVVRNNDAFAYYNTESEWYADTPKVIIDKFPFEVKEADVPSISTTNKQLLDIALNNLEELAQ